MKDCKNCYWYDKCDHIKICEYYDPIYGFESIIRNEYEQSLKERVEEYQKVIDEINS